MPHTHASAAATRANGYRSLYLALWGAAAGGLASFSIARDGTATERSRVYCAALARANRVFVDEARALAWLPLEQSPLGAIGAVDISGPDLASAMPPVALPPTARSGAQLGYEESRRAARLTTSYCLAVSGDFLHAFSSPTATMYTYRISRGWANHVRWGDRQNASC